MRFLFHAATMQINWSQCAWSARISFTAEHPHVVSVGYVCLQSVSFAVFGLGNKQYEHFCAVGKRMHKCMAALGATPVGPRGEGDDDDDIEADFDDWRAKLYEDLDKSALLTSTGVSLIMRAEKHAKIVHGRL